SDEFNPATTVLLNAAPTIALSADLSGDDAVEITQYAAGHLALRTRSSTSGLLVISEIFYPGWQITIDGQRATLMQADSILMAAPVPSGAHQIELTFAPDLVTIGALISAVSLLLWLGVITLVRK